MNIGLVIIWMTFLCMTTFYNVFWTFVVVYSFKHLFIFFSSVYIAFIILQDCFGDSHWTVLSCILFIYTASSTIQEHSQRKPSCSIIKSLYWFLTVYMGSYTLSIICITDKINHPCIGSVFVNMLSITKNLFLFVIIIFGGVCLLNKTCSQVPVLWNSIQTLHVDYLTLCLSSFNFGTQEIHQFIQTYAISICIWFESYKQIMVRTHFDINPYICL